MILIQRITRISKHVLFTLKKINQTYVDFFTISTEYQTFMLSLKLYFVHNHFFIMMLDIEILSSIHLQKKTEI